MDKEAKAQAKESSAEARQQSINCTAEFEHANIAHEDIVDATPPPNLHSKTTSPRAEKLPPSPPSQAQVCVCDDDNPDESPFSLVAATYIILFLATASMTI